MTEVSTVTATTPDVPLNGTEKFYIVAAQVSSTIGHEFKVGFATGGVTTSGGGIGTAVAAADANKVTITAAGPTLVAFGGATISHLSNLFEWSDEAGAVSYTLQYANDAGFSTNLVELTSITVSQKAVPALAEGTYYWRVKTVTGGGDSAFSDVDSFVIIPALSTWLLVGLSLAMMLWMLTRSRRYGKHAWPGLADG